jgi:aquaporin Z
MMKYVNEFIGTFFLVLTIGLTVLEPHSAGALAPIAIGSVLAIMVFAGGHISGGHYNPAVSFAVLLRGRLSVMVMIGYWIVQLIGAAVAAYFVLLMKGHTAEAPIILSIWPTLIGEFLFSFALCHVVLNTATAKETAHNSYFGWAIGFTVLVGAYCVGSISGAAFNPAVAFGFGILNLSAWSNLWIYWVANLLGAIVAAVIFRASHQVD